MSMNYVNNAFYDNTTYADMSDMWKKDHGLKRYYRMEIDKYGEYKVWCHCNGCGEIYDCEQRIQLNNHCMYCTCKYCVCPRRLQNKEYSKQSITTRDWEPVTGSGGSTGYCGCPSCVLKPKTKHVGWLKYNPGK